MVLIIPFLHIINTNKYIIFCMCVCVSLSIHPSIYLLSLSIIYLYLPVLSISLFPPFFIPFLSLSSQSKEISFLLSTDLNVNIPPKSPRSKSHVYWSRSQFNNHYDRTMTIIWANPMITTEQHNDICWCTYIYMQAQRHT